MYIRFELVIFYLENVYIRDDMLGEVDVIFFLYRTSLEC